MKKKERDPLKEVFGAFDNVFREKKAKVIARKTKTLFSLSLYSNGTVKYIYEPNDALQIASGMATFLKEDKVFASLLLTYLALAKEDEEKKPVGVAQT